MGFKIKKADGQVVCLPVLINCDKFRTELGDDGFFESVKCISSKVKPECKPCSLSNPTKIRKERCKGNNYEK